MLILLLILFIVCLAVLYYLETFDNEFAYVESQIDHRKYYVRNLSNKQSAANLLSQIRIQLTNLVNTLYRLYPHEPKIIRLMTQFNPDQLMESASNSQYTSYSVNKGEKIVLCLRQKNEQSELIDANTIFFVAIHELSHLMTVSIGHTQEFWDNMKFLLKFALTPKVALYHYQPFHKDPKPYCGTMITDTPFKLD